MTAIYATSPRVEEKSVLQLCTRLRVFMVVFVGGRARVPTSALAGKWKLLRVGLSAGRGTLEICISPTSVLASWGSRAARRFVGARKRGRCPFLFYRSKPSPNLDTRLKGCLGVVKFHNFFLNLSLHLRMQTGDCSCANDSRRSYSKGKGKHPSLQTDRRHRLFGGRTWEARRFPTI